ncbi:hypothetical protein HDU97_009497 [Phlyctochytrium planicorne]|nr:hypothetical protein HDU97_009497 [Phlyctochytrium planicorne]
MSAAAGAKAVVHPDDKKDTSTWGVSLSYPFLLTPKKYRGVRWLIWILLAVLIVGGILFGAAFSQVKFDNKQKNKKENFFVSASIPEICQSDDPDVNLNPDCTTFTFAQITPLKWDPSAFTLTVQYDISFGSSLVDAIGRLATNVSVVYDTAYASKTIKPNERANSLTIEVPVIVDVSKYPFETYTFELYAIPILASKPPLPIPQVTFLNQQSLPTFVYDTATISGVDNPVFKVTFRRSPVVKGVVIFTWFVMHLWVTIVIFLTAQVIYRNREAGPLMNWVATSVFAMGTIRGAQPLAPPVGTTGDMVTYIYGIFVIALSSFICFIFNFRRYKPKPKDKELEKREKKMKFRKFLKEEEEEEKKKAATPAASYGQGPSSTSPRQVTDFAGSASVGSASPSTAYSASPSLTPQASYGAQYSTPQYTTPSPQTQQKTYAPSGQSQAQSNYYPQTQPQQTAPQHNYMAAPQAPARNQSADPNRVAQMLQQQQQQQQPGYQNWRN